MNQHVEGTDLVEMTVTVTAKYRVKAEDARKSYGTTDIYEMAAIDAENYNAVPEMIADLAGMEYEAEVKAQLVRIAELDKG